MMERVITPCEHDGGHEAIAQSNMETMSTCTTQIWSGPRLWKAHAYNEGEGTMEGMIWIIHFLICLDIDLS